MKRESAKLLDLWRSFADEWKKVYAAAERNIQTGGISIPEFAP